MRERNKRNIVIGLLCVMVVFMSVGYAILSQNLNINGTANITGSWKIEITDISPEEINEGKSVSTSIADSKTEGSFTANLKKPTDAVIYTVTVENKGTIDAVLESITPYSTDGDIKFRTEGKELCEELTAGETCDFTITVEYLDTGFGQIPTPNGTTVTKSFEIKYVQKGANVNIPGGGSGGGEVDNSPAITVDSNGLVTGFNKEKLTNSEGYVVIPATTETGEEIVSIDSGSFSEYNAAMGYAYNEETGEEVAGFIIYDEENIDAIKSIIIGGLDSGIFGSSTSPALGRDINPSKLFGINKKPTVKKLNEEEEAIPWFTESEFLEMISGGSYQTQFMYLYANLETGVLGHGTSQIEKLDLSQAIHLKSIAPGAFMASPLQEIKLTDGIEEIGERAFAESQIKVINLPSSITSIGEDIFDGILEFTKVEIYAENISNNLFSTYSSADLIIENLIIGSNVKTIKPEIFYESPYSDRGEIIIKNLTIEMENIPAGVFNSQEIENLTLGSNVKTIESADISNSISGAFSNNNIINLIIPNNITSIGSYAFHGNQIQTLKLSSSLTTIKEHAFSENQISVLTLPSSLTIIENEAFYGNQIEELTIPSSVTMIGSRTFQMNKLSESTLVFENIQENPCKLTTLAGFGGNRFTKLPEIPTSVTTLGPYAFDDNPITELIIPSSITTIGIQAFYGNQINELIIPSNVITIDIEAFSVGKISNLIFEDTVEKPSQLTTIEGRAFDWNQISGTITLPSSITTLGWCAFSENSNLSKIIIKRANSAGMTLASGWNSRDVSERYFYEVEYNPNYVG